jgi:uncharacterized membrane protein YfcA
MVTKTWWIAHSTDKIPTMLSGQAVAMILTTIVGLSLGALGSGGSILIIPILIYVAGIPPDNAVGMSLVIVATTSLLGVFLHLRRGNVALKPGLLFAATGTGGAYLGSFGTHLLSDRTLMLLFAAIMLIVGIRMWRATTPQIGAFSAARCLLIGFAVGALTGFLGVGGGFLIVPALILFAGLNPKLAVGTSLAVIVLNSTTGVIGHLRFVDLDWQLLAGFQVFAATGMVVGATVASRLTDYRLRRLFAGTLLVLGFAVGIGNLFR